MMRIDKFLSQTGAATRSQARKLIKQGKVMVDEKLAKTPKLKVDENQAVVELEGKRIMFQRYFYYLLNKPQGVITATRDKSQRTVLDLLKAEDRREDIFPVGRLDKDTTGLLVLTNNGDLAHEMLSPRHHVEKTYRALVSGLADAKTQAAFKTGLILRDGLHTQPAKLEIERTDRQKEESLVKITITEGKYHQIKRMFAACGMHVKKLERIAMGSLTLDDKKLPAGRYRELTEEEIEELKKYGPLE